MIGGKILKDDTEWSKLKLKDGMKIIMMGTAEGKALKGPSKETVFVEDMSAEEKAKFLKEKTGEALPAGLNNLGNTCYMNSVIQNLNKVPELKEALSTQESPDSLPDAQRLLLQEAKKLFHQLESKGEPVTPYGFVQALRMACP